MVNYSEKLKEEKKKIIEEKLTEIKKIQKEQSSISSHLLEVLRAICAARRGT